ncbi:uncharacterized protein AKAW2_50523A [Aspergillus luchuensis]|uniref:Uncharacterized protein n=1 Tax=Aspergillus kawachii TaxID=1069201 RepID=A0A7R8A098_ASPKA|nr:uncharacterized protein AKAW2_50473S [Aspergillus luchuensis]XP_041543944.1 uncharacterized protein AKAW2_50523A [Aspergillus luchuensis]BCS00132.1 hypothetical protein AKAW2_50473S [Aspergillus luchuensis]BCS00182.1 hypothetical protein AKAW2_50523A [Aspergillus luchuensis]
MQAKLKQKIEDKTRAFNRALDELHNDQGSRENVAESVLELINVIWPNPAQGGHDSTNFRQIMRYVSNLLRSGDEDQLLSSRSIPSPTYKSVDMPSPAYPPLMERGGAEHTTARAKSPLDRVDGLQTGHVETDFLNMAISPTDLAAIFPEDFYGNMLIDNLNLASQNSQSQGFGTLMAMADNMENSNLDQLTPEDDLSLLSQLTPQLEISMSMDLQPYTSPEFWEAWLAELVPMACPDSPAGLGAPIANLSNEISQSWNGPFPVTPNLHDHLNKSEVSAGLSDSSAPTSTKTAANVNDIATGLEDNNSEPEMIEQISRLDSFRAA